MLAVGTAPILALAAAMSHSMLRQTPQSNRLVSPRMSSMAQLNDVTVQRISDGASLDLGGTLTSSQEGKTLLILGTYAADFNMIEYGQKLRHYLPQLREAGVARFITVVNSDPAACAALAEILDLPAEVELCSDPTGEAGRRFGVNRGWRPDDTQLNPYVKLFGMLVGLGAGGTLPSVIAGYIGNPWGTKGWIESSLAQGQRAGRWPQSALEISDDGKVAINKFDELPLVSSWGRRPLELATLRLQNMMGISIARWSDLQPGDPRCLTQLGGCALYGANGAEEFVWKDNGICGVANFEEILGRKA